MNRYECEHFVYTDQARELLLVNPNSVGLLAGGGDR